MKDGFFGIQFVPVPFCLLDSRYFREKVGKDCLMTYVVLRRYVWRRDTKKMYLDALYRSGELVASIGYRKLADVLCVSTNTAIKWSENWKSLDG